MKFSVLTLFPSWVESYFQTSIVGRAVARGLLDYQVIDVRQFAQGRYRSCDDAPYGGGAGMVMRADPLAAALASVGQQGRVLLPSPAGRPFCGQQAQALSQAEHLILVAGRYEGIDQRFIDGYVDDELSLGDYVLASGELAALVVVDAVARLVPGVINQQSLREESFTDGLLEYPHYTRPEVFEGARVPSVLLSGNHRAIDEWRLKERLKRTARRRSDLLAGRNLSETEKRLLAELTKEGEEDATDHQTG